MPENRTIAICIALSFAVHLMAMIVATLVPWTARKGESVMVVDLADLPRASDFLPPQAGILEGRPPKPAEPPAQARPKAKRKELVPPRMMTGRVPDLPVNPALPAEERFPLARPKDAPAAPPGKDLPQQAARAGEPPGSAGKGAPGAQAPPSESPGGPSQHERGSSGQPLKDLNPSLGKMVLALGKSGGPGSGTGSGNTVASRGKTGERGGIVEEGGGGARLTALNAPEIQYISYFAGIKRKIELVWGYPAVANGIEGDVVVDFVIGRNGKLEKATLVRGSGHRALDEEALSAIRKAAPYAPIPSEYKIANLQIRAHFIYTVTHTRILR
jgi:protein TonB